MLFSTIDCAQEGPTHENLDITTGEITASVTLRTLFTNRLYLADDILENSRPWPYILTAFSPRALTAAIVPAGGMWTIDGQAGYPKYALVTVNYGVPKTKTVGAYDVVAESLEPFGEFIRQDYQQFRWDSKNGTPLTPEESPGKFLAKCKLVRKIYKLATLPVGAMSAYGKCHQSAYVSPLLGTTFDAETLCYDTPSFERTITTTGTDGWNYGQTWIYNPQGWNRFFRAETNAWSYIYRGDNPGASIRWNSYEPADLSGLLQ